MKTNNFKKILAAALAGVLLIGSSPAYAELSDGNDDYLTESEEYEFVEDTEELITDSDEDSLLIDDGYIADAEELNSGESEDALTSGEEAETESEEGLRYIKGRPLTEEEEAEQLAPMYGLTELDAYTIGSDLYDDVPMVMSAGPTTYDARESGWITSVKNQGSYNNCWAYTLASLMETSLLMKGYGAYDLSEEQLSYFFSNRAVDPLGNTVNDTVVKTDGNFRNGGNTMLAAFHLSTWSGMSLDSVYPTGNSSFTEASAYDTAAYLQNAVFSDYSEARLKSLLMQYGAVGVLVYFKASSSYYNASTAALYNPSNPGVNHAVTVVGWDDAYEKENFKNSDSITSDGAWIVKNSWGDSWGDEGYFYLSYEDQTISTLVAVTAEPSAEYSNNYFYDGTSGRATYTLKSGYKMAAAFEVKASEADGQGNPMYDEIIGEIVLAPASDNSSFEIQIYTDLQDPDDPESGTPAYSTPMTVTQQYAGIHTYSITPVRVISGSRYSIVVTNVTGEDVKYYVGYTNQYSSSNLWISFTESAEMQQNFVHRGDGWADRGGVTKAPTFRIKAHTQIVPNSYDLVLYDEDTGEAVSDTETSMEVQTGISEQLAASLIKNGSLWNHKNYPLVYSVTDSDVLTVDEQGNMTPITTGSTTVVITSALVPEKVLTVKVSVYQPASNLKAAAVGAGRIKLTWTKGENIDGYIVYRKEADGTYTVRTGFKRQDVSEYTDVSGATSNVYLKPGVTYTYKLASYRLVDGKKVVLSESNEVSQVSNLAKITAEAKAYSNSTGAYNVITWNKDAYADGYAVYRKEGSGSYSRIAMIRTNGTLKYTDKSIGFCNYYTYAVRAYKDVDGKRYLGTYQSSQKIKSAPRDTKTVVTKSVSSGVSIKWNRQGRATGYIIYRKDGSGSYKKIKTITGWETGTYTDKTAPKNTTVQYAVRAYVKEPYGTVQGIYTATGKIKR